MWTRCYSKEEDEATGRAFHTQCDGKGATVIVAKLSTGKVVGGYAGVSWALAAFSYASSPTSFLFSLSNGFRHALIDGMAAAAQYSGIDGPHFGQGGGYGDFRIEANMNGGACNLGSTYKCRVRSHGSSTCHQDFCGALDGWTIDELEVWHDANTQ